VKARPNKTAFAKLMMDLIHQAGETGNFIYEPEEYRIRGEGERGVVVFLGKPHMVEWQQAVDIVGDLMEAVDIYPPRYRVRSFPSDEQLAVMGNMLP
jgi:hypothetical protein